MAGPNSLPPARLGRDPAQFARWRLATVLLAALPVLSLGLLGAVPPVWLAVRRPVWRTWVAAALFTAASVAEYVLFIVYPAPSSPPTAVISPLILVMWIGATAHFLVELALWRRDVLALSGRPLPYPAGYARPDWQPYPASPQRPPWIGQFGPPGYAVPPGAPVPPNMPPVPPGRAMPQAAPGPHPGHRVPPDMPPVPNVPPMPPGRLAPATARADASLDDDTLGADLGAELRLLGAEFGRDAGAAGAGGHEGPGRLPGPGGAR